MALLPYAVCVVATSGYHSQLMELARKQRMNTDVRKSVFCVIMSSEVRSPWLQYTIPACHCRTTSMPLRSC